jgi:hypothetical protein
MGAAGKDTIYGHGRLYLGDPAVYAFYTWLGASTEWTVAANWDAGSAPDSSVKVIIITDPDSGDNFPVIASGVNAAASRLVVKGGPVTIETGGNLTVGG